MPSNLPNQSLKDSSHWIRPSSLKNLQGWLRISFPSSFWKEPAGNHPKSSICPFELHGFAKRNLLLTFHFLKSQLALQINARCRSFLGPRIFPIPEFNKFCEFLFGKRAQLSWQSRRSDRFCISIWHPPQHIQSLAKMPLDNLFAVVISACVGLAIAGYFSLRRSSCTLAQLPGPPSSGFLFGNFLQVIRHESGFMIQKWFAEYGPVMVFHGLFGAVSLTTTDPKALNHILVHRSYDYPKPFEVQGELGRLLGRGILLAEGEHHKRQRKLISPTFSPAQLRSLAPLVFAVGQKLSAKWTEEISQVEDQPGARCIIDVLPWLSRATLDIIGKAGFGYQFDALESDRKNRLAVALSQLMSAGGVFEGAAGFQVLFIHLLRKFPSLFRIFSTKRSQVIAHSLHVMEEESSKVLDQAKHAYEVQDDRKDLLSLLVRANSSVSGERDKMSNDEVMGQMTTFLFAGHETTASALTWFLWILAKNPEIQSRLRQEIFNATPSSQQATEESDASWTLEQVDALKYLDAVCREGLRFISPVASTVRIAAHDDTIPLSKPVRLRFGKLVDHLTISAGQQIIIPINSFNRSEQIFGKDAQAFNPERWLKSDPPRGGTGVWSGLLTFLAGPRACIGYRFALVELKILLIILIAKFKFEERDVGGGPDFEKKNAIVVRPKIKGEPGGSSMPLRISII
ncbi:hypothetical protein O181_051094 [Austropuccinia psidii MF-1]|uniref:Cytochrome P450 n=1 Tax=Austropuccinia psidii MF-1 TaxID=1389203 RepID=A0A9Q3DY40_9BASI|nr:hypothetical protein [Austropuccinia psidii MF-1]